MNHLMSKRRFFSIVVVIAVSVMLSVIGQHGMAFAGNEGTLNAFVLRAGETLEVVETRSFDTKTNLNYAVIEIKGGTDSLHKLEFSIDPDTGAYVPVNLPQDETYVLSWGTPEGVAALTTTLDEMSALSNSGADFYKYVSQWTSEKKSAVAATVSGEATIISLALGADTFSKLSVPKWPDFDAVTVVAASTGGPEASESAVIIVFWKGGRAAGVRSSDHGPWWNWGRLCCHAFRALCGKCGNAYDNCMDGIGKPCHSWDRCCFLAWLLARLLHI